MNAVDFQKWLSQGKALTALQSQKTINTLDDVQKKDASHQLIEKTSGNEKKCPHCDAIKPHRHGEVNGLQRYKCRDCHRTFNALTGTPLARLRKKEKWLDYSACLKDELSIKAAAKRCDVHPTTAFRWRHRFLSRFITDNASELSGIAEADETYFLESFKGKKKLERKARKRGGKAKKRGLSSEQIPVLIARDRQGETFDQILLKTDAKHLGEALSPLLDKDTLLCSDGSRAFKSMAKTFGIIHKALNIKAGIKVKGKIYHIQNVNAYDSRLKQWIRQFNGVSTKYLNSYLSWRRFIERHASAIHEPKAWLIEAINPIPV